jgi:dTDP-4-dehydrorhamnose 3,5-epimerase
MIQGVEIKQLVTHHDERGYFRELVRKTDAFFEAGFGQWSLSLMHTGVIKAWHVHQIQWDWWYVGKGNLKLVLHDTREQSPTYRNTQEVMLGDDYPPVVVAIPPGVAHGCKVLQGPATLFYITSQTYNPDDEGRIPFDDPDVSYDWLRPPPIT